jgi:hypothetical protein
MTGWGTLARLSRADGGALAERALGAVGMWTDVELDRLVEETFEGALLVVEPKAGT